MTSTMTKEKYENVTKLPSTRGLTFKGAQQLGGRTAHVYVSKGRGGPVVPPPSYESACTPRGTEGPLIILLMCMPRGRHLRT